MERLREELAKRFIGNEEVISILMLNLLHRKSTTLIRAPRGTGKSTLMLLVLKGLFGDEFVVISGASEVKRGRLLEDSIFLRLRRRAGRKSFGLSSYRPRVRG
ncbi:MAG: hypothetical protein QXU11_04630 [Thermoproteota archaeon]